MYRTARPLLGFGAAVAMRPQTFTRVLPTAKRIAAAPGAVATRGYAGKANPADLRLSTRLNKQAALKDAGYAANEIEKSMAMTHIMLPGTFVPVPFSQLNKSPSALWEYTVARLKQRGKDLLTIFGAKVSSMPSWTSRPRAQLNRTKIVPEAKALHQRLGEAMAAGDKDALREICTPRLFETLSATVSRRKASEKLTWELLRYNGSPRVVSHKIAIMPPLGRGPVVQQVVVAIGSSQKLGKFDKATGAPLKGGVRVQNQTEYFVMSRQFDPKTWAPKKWLVWGNTKATTLEDWRLEEKGIQQMEKQDFAKRRGGLEERRRPRGEGRADGTVKSVEAAAALLSHDILERETAAQRGETPQEATNRGGNERTEHAPVVGVQTLGDDEQVARLLDVAVVIDHAKEEDGQDATEATSDHLEAAPPVESVREAKHQDRDDGGGDQIGDEVDLQHGRGLERDDDGGDDDEHDAGADPPDVEAVAEQVVGGGGDHGRLQGVEGRGGEGADHDQHNTDDPGGHPLQQQEEGDGAALGDLVEGQGAGPGGDQTRDADHGEDAEDDDDGDGDADAQVLVRLGGEGAQPEAREEEVVCEDADGEDVEELPAKKGGLQEARGLDQGGVNVRLDTHCDGDDDDEADDHGALEVVCQEGDAETAEGWGCQSGFLGHVKDARHTGVDGGDDTLHYHDGQPVQARQSVDDLADGGQLCDHVQEQRDERHEAEVQHGNRTIALPRPCRQDEPLRGLAADDGTQDGENEERERGREGVDHDALDPRDRGELRVGEEDSGAEG
ncbi:hypothetical protein Ct61P_13102 [Colletotrichum tofieldiae]|nr:hypothetical protein Ct61P_13102 [Colletotrichum tofieldiae]